MRNFLACLTLIAAIPASQTFAYGSLPESPVVAFSNCTAKVKVSVARLRSGPSLESQVLGVVKMDEPLFVSKVCGKWVQVALESGDTAYVAAYLLSFPYAELLEQWKKDTPPPTVGKKARVKWAAVNFRSLPGASSGRMGRFLHGEEIAVLSQVGAWSLVEARSEDGKSSCFGFVASRALAPPEIPDPVEWTAPVACLHAAPHALPASETPAQYLARTAWSPQLFAAEWHASRAHPALPPGQYLAVR